MTEPVVPSLAVVERAIEQELRASMQFMETPKQTARRIMTLLSEPVVDYLPFDQEREFPVEQKNPTAEFLAYNIVNQIADTYYEAIPSEKWVEVRQATNDRLWKWVEGMISRPTASEGIEKTLRQFHGNDVWKDDRGYTWVPQSALVEAVLAEVHRRPEIAAQALRDAAKALSSPKEAPYEVWASGAGNWLRERADTIEGKSS